MSSEVVSILRSQLRYTRGCLKADPGDAGANSRLIMLGNTLAKTLEAARKLQQDGAEAVEQMSFKERADLFVNWFAALPPTYRVALKAKMDDFEAQLAIPQPQAENEN